MALLKLFPQKDNFLSLSFSSNNYGANEILYVAVSSSGVANHSDPLSADDVSFKTLTRPIIQWDLTSQAYLNAITGSYTATLTLYNAKNNVFTDENFNIEIYPLLESWNEGQYSYMWPGTGYSNWVARTPNNLWSTSGGTYTASPSASINFPIGTENLTANISAFVEYWKTNTNNGLLFKFTDAVESATGLSGSYTNTKTFFSKDTHTLFQPYISIQTQDNLLFDDVANLHIGNNNIFIYDTNVTGSIYSGTAAIKADLYATGATAYTINYFAPYIWYITLPFTTYSGVVGPWFLVSSNTALGYSLTSSITGQELYFTNKIYVSSIDASVVTKSEYSASETPSIRCRVFKYVHRMMGSRSVDYYPQHVFVGWKEKNTYTLVQDFQELNYDQDGYFGTLVCSNFLPSFWYVPTIKVIESNGNIWIKDIPEAMTFIRE